MKFIVSRVTSCCMQCAEEGAKSSKRQWILQWIKDLASEKLHTGNIKGKYSSIDYRERVILRNAALLGKWQH